MDFIHQADWEAFSRDPREETFRPLYEKSKALVWTICLRILRNEEDASDALQSAFCRLVAIARGAETEAADDARQLIYRVTVREANNLRMRRHRRGLKEVAVEEFPLVAAATPGAAELVQQAQTRAQVMQIVETLPEHYRLPVQLHYFDGLTHREVAIVMNKPVSTISNRIATAHRKLEGRLKRAGLGGAAMLLAMIGAHAAPMQPPMALSAEAIYAQALNSLVSYAGEAAGVSRMLSAEPAARRGFFNMSPVSLAVLTGLVLIATFITLRDISANAAIRKKTDESRSAALLMMQCSSTTTTDASGSCH